MVILRFLTSGNSYTAEVGSVDEKTTLTNVPVQSTLEETDTNKLYTKLYTYAGGSTPQWVEQGNTGYL